MTCNGGRLAAFFAMDSSHSVPRDVRRSVSLQVGIVFDCVVFAFAITSVHLKEYTDVTNQSPFNRRRHRERTHHNGDFRLRHSGSDWFRLPNPLQHWLPQARGHTGRDRPEIRQL